MEKLFGKIGVADCVKKKCSEKKFYWPEKISLATNANHCKVECIFFFLFAHIKKMNVNNKSSVSNPSKIRILVIKVSLIKNT